MKYPKPTTTRAYLISAGLEKPTPTVHHYYKTEPEILSGQGGAAWVHYYQCFKTGALRVWGNEERLQLVRDVDSGAVPMEVTIETGGSKDPNPEAN